MDKRQIFMLMVQTGALAMESDPQYRGSAAFAMTVVMEALYEIPEENIRDDLVGMLNQARDYVYYQYFQRQDGHHPARPSFMRE